MVPRQLDEIDHDGHQVVYAPEFTITVGGADATLSVDGARDLRAMLGRAMYRAGVPTDA